MHGPAWTLTLSGCNCTCSAGARSTACTVELRKALMKDQKPVNLEGCFLYPTFAVGLLDFKLNSSPRPVYS